VATSIPLIHSNVGDSYTTPVDVTMIDELRRIRERCEPKSNQNPRYLRYSNAVSALLCVPYWASHPYP